MSSLCGCPPLSTVIRRPSLFVSVGPSGRHHFCLFDPSVVTLTTVVRTPLLWLSLFSHRFGCFFVSNRRLIHHFGHLRQSGRSSLSIISGPSGYRRFIASSNVSVSGETSLSLAPSPSLCLLSVVVLSPVQLFLVICPVLSGRPPFVRSTLHPEASIGHSANYSVVMHICPAVWVRLCFMFRLLLLCLCLTTSVRRSPSLFFFLLSSF